jgi:hypothetical protein
VLDGRLKGFDGNELPAARESPPFASDDGTGLKLPMFILRVGIGGDNSVAIVGEVLRVYGAPNVSSFIDEVDVDGRNHDATTILMPSNV